MEDYDEYEDIEPDLHDDLPDEGTCMQCGSDEIEYIEDPGITKCHSCGFVW